MSALRQLVREVLKEDLKNVGSRHQRTATGTTILRRMHDAPGVLSSLSSIDDPRELAQVIQAIIDAVPLTSREEISKALNIVTRHERTTHTR